MLIELKLIQLYNNLKLAKYLHNMNIALSAVDSVSGHFDMKSYCKLAVEENLPSFSTGILSLVGIFKSEFGNSQMQHYPE